MNELIKFFLKNSVTILSYDKESGEVIGTFMEKFSSCIAEESFYKVKFRIVKNNNVDIGSQYTYFYFSVEKTFEVDPDISNTSKTKIKQYFVNYFNFK